MKPCASLQTADSVWPASGLHTAARAVGWHKCKHMLMTARHGWLLFPRHSLHLSCIISGTAGSTSVTMHAAHYTALFGQLIQLRPSSKLQHQCQVTDCSVTGRDPSHRQSHQQPKQQHGFIHSRFVQQGTELALIIPRYLPYESGCQIDCTAAAQTTLCQLTSPVNCR